MGVRYAAGQTALMLPVPDAEPVVGQWREQFEPSAAYGMPAHLTVMFPFLTLDCIESDETDELRRLFAGARPIPVEFAAFGSFPEVLYLRPEPAAPLVELTARVARRWPEARPYSGAFDEVVPHLTVAVGVDDGRADDIRAQIGRALPLRAVLREAWLVAFTDARWSPVASFAFGESPS